MWVDHREEQLSDLGGVGGAASLGFRNLPIGKDLPRKVWSQGKCQAEYPLAWQRWETKRRWPISHLEVKDYQGLKLVIIAMIKSNNGGNVAFKSPLKSF